MWVIEVSFLQHVRFPVHQGQKNNLWGKFFASAVLKDDYAWPSSVLLAARTWLHQLFYGVDVRQFSLLVTNSAQCKFCANFFSSTTFRFFSFPPFAILQMSRSSKGSGCWRSTASYTSYLRFCSNEWPSQVLTSSSVRFSSSTLTGWASLFFCNADNREKSCLLAVRFSILLVKTTPISLSL